MSQEIHSKRCACSIDQDQREQHRQPAREGDPDFYVNGDKKVGVWWTDESYFKNVFGTTRVVASAGGDHINLNRQLSHLVDGQLLGHEYAHNLGYGHIDGTVVDTYLDLNEDGKGGDSLTEVSRDVFESMDGALVIDWSDGGGWGYKEVLVEYLRGNTHRGDMQYAFYQWRHGDRTDAFFTSNFSSFGRDDFPEEQLPRGSFYSAGV